MNDAGSDSDAEQRAFRRLFPCDDSDDPSSDELEQAEPAETGLRVAGYQLPRLVDDDTPPRTLELETHAALGIGFQVWPAAGAGVEFAATTPTSWRGVRVLELGAGIGLTGLALALFGAHVTLTDLPEVVSGPLARNVERNAAAVAAAGGSACARPLAWGDESHLAALGGGRWDVLVAADVVYRRALFMPLVSSVRALAGPGTHVLIAGLKRWRWESEFWRELVRAGFAQRVEVWAQPQPEPGQRRPVRVYQTQLA